MASSIRGMIELSFSNGTVLPGSSSNDMTIYVGSNSQRIILGCSNPSSSWLSIGTTGNVGVNTVSAIERLHVEGKIYSGVQILNTSNDSSNVPSYSFLGDSNTGMYHASNDTLGFVTSGIERMRIVDSGFVGIGKSNPLFPLDVTGDLNFTGVLRQNGAAYIGSQWSNNAANVFLLGSNVGIGTSSPQQPLEVNGTIITRSTTSPTIIIVNSNTNQQAVIAVAASALQFSSSAASNDLVIRSDNATSRVHIQSGTGTSAITINSNNNVGIGTSTPAYRLDVTGDLNFTGVLRQNGAAYIGSQWSNNAANVFLLSSNVGIGTTTPNASFDVNGVIMTRSTTTPQISFINSNNSQQSIIAMATSAAQYSSSAASNDLVIRTDNPTSRLHLLSGTGAAAITVNSNNNVGIGKTNPSSLLDVNGIVTVTSNLLFNNSVTAVGSNARILLLNTDTQASYNGFGIAGSTLVNSISSTANLFAFGVTSASTFTEMMRLTGTGRLGIGTNSPQQPLDVNGIIQTRSTTSPAIIIVNSNNNQQSVIAVAASALQFSSSAASNDLVIRSDNATSRVHIQSGTGTSAITINSNNNVGIGTSSPLDKLTVNGNLRANLITGSDLQIYGSTGFINGDFNVQAVFRAGTSGYGMTVGGSYSSTSPPLNGMIIEGNVGIGITTPNARFDVNGVIMTRSTTTPQISFINSNNSQQSIIAMATSAAQFSSSAASNDLIIRSDNATSRVHIQSGTGTSAITINSNNNVGISTSTAAYRLDVSGQMNCTQGYRIAALSPGYLLDNFFGIYGSSDRYGVHLDNGGVLRMFVSGAGFIGTISLAHCTSNGVFTDRLYVANNGYVGIGTTTPETMLSVNGTCYPTSLQVAGTPDVDFTRGPGNNSWPQSVPNHGVGYTGAPISGYINSNVGLTTFAGYAGIAFITEGNMNGCISAGFGANMMLGSDLSFSSMQTYMYNRSARLHLEVQNYTTRSATGAFINFYNYTTAVGSTPNLVGSISYTGSVVAYNTTSDYRIKDVIGPVTDALDKVLRVKPIYFTLKADEEKTLQAGTLAHELAEVFPEVVIGEKDAVDDNGDILIQQVGYTSLIPTLIASIQDLHALITKASSRIQDLEQEVITLKSQLAST